MHSEIDRDETGVTSVNSVEPAHDLFVGTLAMQVSCVVKASETTSNPSPRTNSAAPVSGKPKTQGSPIADRLATRSATLPLSWTKESMRQWWRFRNS